AVVVARDDTKAIRPWSQIVVERLAPASRLLPAVVPAFQLVAKRDFLRCDVAQSDEVDLEITSERRQANGPGGGVTPAVGDDLLDMHRRRYRVLSQVRRIEHLHHGVVGEPKPSVG